MTKWQTGTPLTTKLHLMMSHRNLGAQEKYSVKSIKWSLFCVDNTQRQVKDGYHEWWINLTNAKMHLYPFPKSHLFGTEMCRFLFQCGVLLDMVQGEFIVGFVRLVYFCEHVFMLKLQNITDNMSTVFHARAWCHLAMNNYLSQHWLCSLLFYHSSIRDSLHKADVNEELRCFLCR